MFTSFDMHGTESLAQSSERRREVLASSLQLLAAILLLVPYVVGWAGKHEVFARSGLAIILAWMLYPRVKDRWARMLQNRKDRRFIAASELKMNELVGRFGVFISQSDNRSFIQIVRSGLSHQQTAVERVIVSNYVGSWFQTFLEQLQMSSRSLSEYLRRCREFGTIVSEFNSGYVLRAHQVLVSDPLSIDFASQLEEFRGEFIPFLQDFELWATAIRDYLINSKGIHETTEHWRLAPLNSFARVKSFAPRATLAVR